MWNEVRLDPGRKSVYTYVHRGGSFRFTIPSRARRDRGGPMTRKQALARLGVKDSASADEVKRAYRKLAFELHPDLHPNNPDASKEFQLLNEAYVFLTSAEQPSASGRPQGQSRSQSRAEATEKARTEAQRAYERAKKRFHEEEKSGKTGADTSRTASSGAPQGGEKTREMKRDEVLRDLLRDPFARRVFEDIYSQIREEASRKQTTGRAGRGKISDIAEPGLIENVSDWLRRQIDEEQTVRVAGPLTPGKRLRLQISPGVFGKAQTIELTLPPQFEPGRPIRLKGMGKRIGKWRGDLYLRITN